MILMHLYRDWNCELRAQLMVIGCFVWNWMWFCFYFIKISEADAFCESGSPNPSCLALATSLWSDPATILCQYDQDLQQSAPRSTTLLRSRPQVHGRRGNKQDSARPRAHQEQEGIGRRIEAEIASAAGEALAGGLLWQWLRAVRVGRVLWGARGLQQALRKWFQAQFHALLKFIALYFDYLDFVFLGIAYRFFSIVVLLFDYGLSVKWDRFFSLRDWVQRFLPIQFGWKLYSYTNHKFYLVYRSLANCSFQVSHLKNQSLWNGPW